MAKVLTRILSGKKDFDLNNQPVAFAISVHMRNMFATYGSEEVKLILKELYGLESTVKVSDTKKRKKSS